ncbi:calcium-binding protein [Geminicoccus flavidas]|uniref:calcium-binding protein n=1 Tax=Geminicoccus flavidas TaxID=2506407 RepID=UPI00135B343F|nr:calcium-binding protein [Geminicoccus flavidas]
MADIYGTEDNDWGANELLGTNNADNIFGYGGHDWLKGRGGADNLFGEAGDDLLYGDAGSDHLYGGAGADNLTGGTGVDHLAGGSGIDIASYTQSGAAVTVSLATGTGSGGEAEGDTLQDIEGLTGSAHADTLTGNGADNKLRGLGGNDTLSGGAGGDRLWGDGGDDILKGGSGADDLMGGTGTDTASYAGAGQAINLSLSAGTGYSGDAAGDRFFDIENVMGSSFGDMLQGSSGANRFDGGNGDDHMIADAGADMYVGGDGVDSVNYVYSGAINVNMDTNQSSGGLAAGDKFYGVERIYATGGADTVTGNGLDNILYGLSGLDRLSGGAGKDTLVGGSQLDILTGGSNADTFVWTELTDSLGNGFFDIVKDFSHAQGDKLDLSGLDELGGNVTFRGTGQFTGADQVRYYNDNGNTIVEVNAVGASGTDLRFQLDGLHSLVAGDFVF